MATVTSFEILYWAEQRMLSSKNPSLVPRTDMTREMQPVPLYHCREGKGEPKNNIERQL